MNLTVIEYQTAAGNSPVSDWLGGLDKRTAAVVDTRIGRVRSGNLGDWKSVGDGVFEMRIDFGPGYRVYFGRKGRTVVVLLCAGSKRTQGADIRLAKEYWNDYESSE